MFKKVFLICLTSLIGLISCQTDHFHHNKDTIVYYEEGPEIICNTITDAETCMSLDHCKISFKCTGKQFCNLIKEKELCEIFWCDWYDSKCNPEGNGFCKDLDHCPIIKGCRIIGSCVAVDSPKKSKTEL